MWNIVRPFRNLATSRLRPRCLPCLFPDSLRSDQTPSQSFQSFGAGFKERLGLRIGNFSDILVGMYSNNI